MKKLNYLLFFLIVSTSAWAAWDNTLPADNSVWNNAAGFTRNNWDALEVALGVDISMEGSASPWYQATAPTTTADGSTALTSANDGLLWVDSDNRVLNTYIDGTGFVGADTIPDLVTFTAADATPTVLVGRVFKTDSGALTITDFDDGTAGKVIFIESAGAIVFDTTTAVDSSHNLDGSSGDITTASGDITVWQTSDGTTWDLIRWNDASFDNGATLAKSSELTTGTATLTVSGTQVFNTTMTSANTFQDLDLSGTIGSNSTLVHLEIVVAAAAGSSFYAAKTKGEGSATFTEHYQSGGNPSGGGVHSGEAASSSYGQTTLLTDSSGVIQHGFTNNTSTITVKLLAYIQ